MVVIFLMVPKRLSSLLTIRLPNRHKKNLSG